MYMYKVCLTPSDISAQFSSDIHTSEEEKCKDVLFMSNFPPFHKFKINQSHLPFCNVDYENVCLFEV